MGGFVRIQRQGQMGPLRLTCHLELSRREMVVWASGGKVDNSQADEKEQIFGEKLLAGSTRNNRHRRESHKETCSAPPCLLHSFLFTCSYCGRKWGQVKSNLSDLIIVPSCRSCWVTMPQAHNFYGKRFTLP